MIGFCGALDFDKRQVKFSELKKMCGLHGVGSAFINGEFGIICDGVWDFDSLSLQPVTVSYNNALYTAAVVVPAEIRGMEGNTAQGVLEGYFEEGDEYIRRLDFSYALALYDGRCGELLLVKGGKGDKALFYTQKDGTLYFSSSLRPLFRLYGGCVRVNRRVLLEHIKGGYSPIPDGLFEDIHYIRASHSLLCSRFESKEIPFCSVSVSFSDKKILTPPEVLYFSKKTDMRKILTDALFAFDYPQFDYMLPLMLPYSESAGKGELGNIVIGDPIKCLREEYSLERADRIGGLWGVDILVVQTDEEPISARELKAIEKQIDIILDEYRKIPTCVLANLEDSELLGVINDEKDIKLRIRRKGMLVQTAMWFECYNLVLT